MAAEARAREAEANDAPGAPDAAPDRRAEAQGEKIKIGGDLELTENEIRDLVSRKAAEDSKSLTRPQKAEDFKFGLSPNFQPPAGLGCVVRVGEAHQMNVLKKAEVAKLGAAGTQRVDAVVRWMTGTMGTAAADMARVLQAVPMASTIVAFENLIQRLTNQDSVAYSPTGRRVEGGDGRISGYDNMTFAQKRAAQDDQRRQR